MVAIGNNRKTFSNNINLELITSYMPIAASYSMCGCNKRYILQFGVTCEFVLCV